MFSSNPIKLFRLVIIFLLCFSACRFWGKSAESPTPAPTPFVAQEIPSEIPFSTKEPEIYQAEIINSTFSNGEKIERKTFKARNGGKYLTTFNLGEKQQVSQLQIEGKTLLIHQAKKVYTENVINPTNSAYTGETLNDFLTIEWLNQKTSAKFENRGEENGLTKYLVSLGDVPNSEAVIFVNESFKIAVKQEFFSGSGEQKTLMFSTEITNLKLVAEENLFEIPKDFKKISPKEFQDILWQEKFKNTE